MNNTNPSLPSGMGDIYIRENIGRALSDLCSSSSTWRERVLEACRNAHRPNDDEFFTGYMSDETLQRWRDCKPYRFKQAEPELIDDQIEELASALISYLQCACRDLGMVEVGIDPKEHHKYGTYYLDDESQSALKRNSNTRS